MNGPRPETTAAANSAANTMFGASYGQTDGQAFQAAQWATALMPTPEFIPVGIQRGPSHEAIGHREVVSW